MSESAPVDPATMSAALASANERIDDILESITDALAIVDREWRITTLNSRAKQIGAALTGSEAPLTGRVLWEAVPEFRSTSIEHELRRAMDERVRVEIEHPYSVGPVNVWFEIRGNPV